MTKCDLQRVTGAKVIPVKAFGSAPYAHISRQHKEITHAGTEFTAKDMVTKSASEVIKYKYTISSVYIKYKKAACLQEGRVDVHSV